MKSLSNITGEVENAISKRISTITAHDWDEDFITRNVLHEIYRILASEQYEGKDYRRSISWQMYKLKGTYETNFGDVAFVVNIYFKDGSSITGAAFLEAKKRAWSKTDFKAMRMDQAKRILRNAPRAHYLLYDYENITSFHSGTSLMGVTEEYFKPSPFANYTLKTNAVCCPLNLAVESKIKNTTLYRHSTPFSQMITGRYFQGLDLEFSETALKIATGFLDKFGLPKNVVELEITDIGAEPDESSARVNRNIYQQLG